MKTRNYKAIRYTGENSFIKSRIFRAWDCEYFSASGSEDYKFSTSGIYRKQTSGVGVSRSGKRSDKNSKINGGV